MEHKTYIFKIVGEWKILTDRKVICFFPPILDKYSLQKFESDPLQLLVDRWANHIFLKKIELDAICFLAENGPHSASDMYKGPAIPRGPRKRGRPPSGKKEKLPRRDETKKLVYDYKRILRHADKLVQMRLLQSEKKKKKDILALTFDGFHVYLQNIVIHERDRETKHLGEAITANSKLLPFAKHWNEIVRIVGKKTAHQSVADTIQHQIFRYPVNVGEINLKFDSFLIEPNPAFPKISKKKQDIGLADFVSRSPELRNSYITYLAVHDILYLTSQDKWSERDLHLENFESEKALAFFEKRDIGSKPLFVSETRLKEFLPKFGTVEYFFTGLLMEKLLQ